MSKLYRISSKIKLMQLPTLSTTSKPKVVNGVLCKRMHKQTQELSPTQLLSLAQQLPVNNSLGLKQQISDGFYG